MIFLTVGTLFPFDRLVQAVDECVGLGKLEGPVFAQVGKGGFRPLNFESVETMDKNTFDDCFDQAGAVIAHAGMGTITMALDRNKPILVMPRRKIFREVVNDHQVATAKHFEMLGHVIAAYDIAEIPQKAALLKSFLPVPRNSQVEKLAERVGRFLEQCQQER